MPRFADAVPYYKPPGPECVTCAACWSRGCSAIPFWTLSGKYRLERYRYVAPHGRPRYKAAMNVGKIKVAVVFPSEATTPAEILRQEIEGVRTHFAGARANLTYAAPKAALPTYRALFPELNIVSAPHKFMADEHVVLLESYHDQDGYSAHWESGDRAIQAGATASSIKFSGRIVPYKRDWASSELQNMDANIFNQLSPREPWGFYYFPFGYLFRFLGMGPINSFGCRITQSLPDLARRDKNHKVVACFGGSAAWSMFCLHHQMYTELLQQRLNAYSKEQRSRTAVHGSQLRAARPCRDERDVELHEFLLGSEAGHRCST